MEVIALHVVCVQRGGGCVEIVIKESLGLEQSRVRITFLILIEGGEIWEYDGPRRDKGVVVVVILGSGVRNACRMGGSSLTTVKRTTFRKHLRSWMGTNRDSRWVPICELPL
jgi:hypothetical protein